MSNNIRVFIHDEDSIVHKNNKDYNFSKDTINGNMYVTSIDWLGQESIITYHFQTSKEQRYTDTSRLLEYETAFNERVKAHTEHFSKWYNNVKIVTGNIKVSQHIGYKNIGVFVAIWDDKVIFFESHFYPQNNKPSAVCSASGDAIETGHNDQRLGNIDLVKGMATPTFMHKLDTANEIIKHKVKRKHLCPSDKQSILGRFKMGRKGYEIAVEFNISTAKVSLLKKEFIKEGKL